MSRATGCYIVGSVFAGIAWILLDAEPGKPIMGAVLFHSLSAAYWFGRALMIEYRDEE